MKIQEIEEVCKDGTECILRPITPDDAQTMITLLQNLSRTTDYMLPYPEECTVTLEEEREILANVLQNPKKCFIGCFVKNEIVGSIGIYPEGERKKLCHRCHIGLGVRDDFRGKGVGSLLLEHAIAWAKGNGYEQMELDVVSENACGIALYEKFGFQRVGQIPHGIKRKEGGYYLLNLMVLDLLKISID